jgi:hypothetical protein
MTRGLRSGLGALFVLALVQVDAAPAGAALTCDKIPQLAGHFLRKHVSHRTLNEELVRRTAEAYLDKMDPSKTLLLRPEADAIVASFSGVFEGASTGDCQPLLDIHAKVVERYEELETKARAIVTAEDFAIDPETQLIIDPKERGRPETPEERDNLLRRQIDFQLANYLSSGTSLEDSKQRLVHRYELFTRRAREFDLDDLHSNFLDAFASSLDPHSNYLSAEALEDFQIAMTLSLEGIGVALSSRRLLDRRTRPARWGGEPPGQPAHGRPDHRRGPGAGRVGRHHRHGAAGRRASDPGPARHTGDAHGAPGGRDDRALPGDDHPGHDRPRGAGRGASLRDGARGHDGRREWRGFRVE